jgi:hypothetical protein
VYSAVVIVLYVSPRTITVFLQALAQHSTLAPHIICRYVSSSVAAGKATHTGQVLREMYIRGASGK